MSASTITTEGYGPGSTIHLIVLSGYGSTIGTITSTRLTKDIEVVIHREAPDRYNFKVDNPK